MRRQCNDPKIKMKYQWQISMVERTLLKMKSLNTHTHTNNIVMELKFWSQVHEFKLQLCHLLEEWSGQLLLITLPMPIPSTENWENSGQPHRSVERIKWVITGKMLEINTSKSQDNIFLFFINVWVNKIWRIYFE